jgi:hypothetical protein
LAEKVTATIVHVGTLPFGGAGDRDEQWLRKTTRFFEGGARVQWTDTRTCPAARAVLSNMYALEMPRPTKGGVIEVRADGVDYALSTDGRFQNGRIVRLSISAPRRNPVGRLGGAVAGGAERLLVRSPARRHWLRPGRGPALNVRFALSVAVSRSSD